MLDPTTIVLDENLLHPQFMCFIGIIIILLIIPLTFSIIKFKKNKKKYFIPVLILLSVLIVAALGFEIYLYQDCQYQLHHDYLEYSLELDSNSEEFHIAIFPITENRDLQNSIKIKDGNGEIEIINTEYGKALMVNFSNKIRIKGELDTTNGIGNHDLTMANKSEEYSSVDYWIYYEPNNQTNYNCSFDLKLFHESFDWWEFHQCEGYLKDGWNIYWAEHGAES